ncbi:ABC transporter ATP-binding protein [Candidatus Berkelbacteria bacterium]|nr:ABC transporter ATP-binding protein [Candidatus Berkelbacteria bacterium]
MTPVSHDHHPIPPIIRFAGVSKTYGKGEAATKALIEASFDIEPGSFTAIIGPSGSGKSTILNILGLLDRPSEGEYWLDGKRADLLTDDTERARLRRESIGFVFQQFNLLPKASALENVMMPGVYTRLRHRKERATALLKLVGLGHRLHHRPNQMSGGEQQRVAVARSLLNDPKVLLADEPTGNLDSTTGDAILGLLRDLNKDGKTVIVVTHDPAIAEQADSTVQVKDGKVESPERSRRVEA